MLVLLVLHQDAYHVLVYLNAVFCILQKLLELLVFLGEIAQLVRVLSINEGAHLVIAVHVVLIGIKVHHVLLILILLGLLFLLALR